MRRIWKFVFLGSLLSLQPAWAEQRTFDGMSPAKALDRLESGNRRFLSGNFRSDGRGPSERRKLASEVAPHSVVIACSDARVPPELVFDQSLGEMVTIRVAGEALDNAVIATIEHAVSELNVRHIFVLGHTKCHSVGAAVKTPKGEDQGSPSQNQLIAEIRPRVDRGPAAVSSKSLEIEAGQNARQVAADIMGRSVIVAEAVREGRVEINSGLYFLESGRVDFY